LERQERIGNLHRMVFKVPFESRQAELSTDSFGVVLTQDDPDILLDPGRWADHMVRIERVRFAADSGTVSTTMAHSRFLQHYESMLRNNPQASWFLDEVFTDPNTPRMLEFLEFIAESEATQ
jgi:hypothetical protein